MFPILVVAMMMLMLFYEDIVDLVRRDVAWKTEITADRRESIESFALDEDGSAWILTLDYYSGYREPTSYNVKHIGGEEVETLSLPIKDELFPGGDERFTYPTAIALSSKDLPVLVFFSPEPLLYWTGSEWVWVSSQGIRNISPVASNIPYWKSVKETSQILVEKPYTSERVILSLGEYEKDFTMEYRTTYDGWTVVAIMDKHDKIYFHSFKENTDQHIWYELEYNLDEYGRLVDYTVDSSGDFYILFYHRQSLCEDGSVAIGIGKYHKDQGAWQLLDTNYPDDCNGVHGYDQLIVDSRARVWIPVGRAVVVYNPSIWEERELTESEYRYYTESNSGYYVGHELVIGSDSRIWSLDSSGDALVWIDSEVDQLERPICPWLSWMDEQWGLRLYVGIGSVAALTLIAVVLSFVNRRRPRDVE